MAPKSNTAPQTKETNQMRVTSTRSFYRGMNAKLAHVPEQTDTLLRKESDCCSRATD